MKAEMSVSRFFTSSKPKSTTTSSKFKGEDLAYLKNVIRNQHQSAPSQASTKVDSSKDENSRNSNKLSQTKLNMWVQGLDQFEMDIMEKMGSKRRKIAHTFEKEPSFEIFVSLKLFPQSHDYSVSIDSVARRPKCTPIGIYLDRLCNHSVYSSLYILRVKFAKSNPKDVKHVLNDIADNALQCFGESFHFLGSKDDQEYAYFVKLPKEYPSIDSLLDSIAAFSQLKNISLLGLRTGLLVSSVAQVVVNSSNDPVYTLELVLVEDIYNEFSECCSDGAGYISLALAKELPSRVSSGIDISNEGSSLPSWFQVRILCEFGVFKGTLLVLSELEGNVIVLRKSMQKVKGKTKRSVSKGNRVSSVFQFNWQVIDQILLNNDELSKQPSSFIMGIVNAGGNESNYYGKLNVGVLQLLCACGVNIEDIKDGLK